MPSMPREEQKTESVLQKTTLKGHRGAVNCVAHSSSVRTNRTSSGTSSCYLLSGSDDGTARLWDLRSQRAALCILAPACEDGTKEVTSVAFHPAGGDSIDTKTDDLDGTSEAKGYAKNMSAYLSVGSSVYGYDLRNAVSPIIREYDSDLSGALECQDEVNQIAFSFPRKGSNSGNTAYIAAANDLGDVRVASDIVPARASPESRSKTKKTIQRCRVLQHAEDGAAMATCTAFRPRSSGLDLASGGTDCAVRLWDVMKPRRPSCSMQIASDDAGAAQVCNPPMAFDLSWSPSGKFLAAGLGDGTASILFMQGRSMLEKCRLRGGHSSSIASVLFPAFGCESSSHVAANDRLLISAGSDGAIMFWDLGADVAGNNAVDPSSWLVGSDVRTSNIDQDLAALALNDKKSQHQQQARILFGIPHNEKINFVTSSKSNEPVLPSSLFVADTSCDITAYIVARK
mmetsp:Transcript_26957/g.58926  ORF Transcript_26957/g.58926 Transcript_26957/m.58926 type:complete len:457 (-) Transcript_26957:27-1397(-)